MRGFYCAIPAETSLVSLGKLSKEVLLVFDDYSRTRLNEEEVIRLENVIQEIKQLYNKDTVKHTILNQELVLRQPENSTK